MSITTVSDPNGRNGVSKLTSARPRLAFFRPDNPALPTFIRQHLDEHVRCLETFFDVTLIEEDCDYDEVCSRVRPDLALFESGVYARIERRIKNTHRHPGIPKIGLLNSDAYCQSRSVFLADMDEWGVETFFTISMSLRGRAPQSFRERLYVWPNFADTQRFHTYPGGKQTRILFAGSQAPHYPWRSRVNRLLADRFPINTLPHAGWEPSEHANKMVSGDAYALTLSGALIAPTCGTVANELVRKHLEIPACGALLLTERTAAVEAAGFVDMETCVFASEEDVVDKVEYLLSNPDEIARISANGQALAHARHDLKHRNQVFQWYELSKRASASDIIVQPDPFGPMTLQSPGQRETPRSEVGNAGRDWSLIVAGDSAAEAGDAETARSNYLATLNYHYEAEAALGLARLALRSGNASLAREWVWNAIIRVTHYRGCNRPDPVEWSVFILTMLCAGDTKRAVAAARQYTLYTHDELSRVRRLVHELSATHPAQGPNRRRLSIHRDRALSWSAWLEDTRQMLAACGQTDLAERASRLSSREDPAEGISRLTAPAGPRKTGPGSRDVPRHHWSKLGLRARFFHLRYRLRKDHPAIENPIPAMLSGRKVTTVALIGVPSGDRVGHWARHACRRNPEPCMLVTVGDPPGPDTSLSSIPERGNDALGERFSLPIALNERSIALIGPAASRHWPSQAYRGAMLVIMTDATKDDARALAMQFDSDAAWRRLDMPTPVAEIGVAAWEPA